MKSKHTPGLWRLEHDHTAICCGNQTLARIYHGEGRSYEENCANAKLMGAAKDLRKAISLTVDALDPEMSGRDIIELRESLITILATLDT